MRGMRKHKEEKLLIKINSNDKSTEGEREERRARKMKNAHPQYQLDVKRATKECKGER